MRKIFLFLCAVFMAAPIKADAKECFDNFVWNADAGACVRFEDESSRYYRDIATGEYVPFDEAAVLAGFVKMIKAANCSAGKVFSGFAVNGCVTCDGDCPSCYGHYVLTRSVKNGVMSVSTGGNQADICEKKSCDHLNVTPNSTFPGGYVWSTKQESYLFMKNHTHDAGCSLCGLGQKGCVSCIDGAGAGGYMELFCTKCASGYVEEKYASYLGYPSNAVTCQQICNIDNCEDCFDDQPNRCYKCKYGYVAQNDVCVPCPENAYCSDGRTISCKTGYALKNGACVINCPANCSACSSATTCAACDAGYSLQSGKCVEGTVAQCPSDSSMSSDGCCCIPK